MIVFNGEIYNHLELRKELEALGHSFRGHCDTETVLHAFLQWDTDAFARLRGPTGIRHADRVGLGEQPNPASPDKRQLGQRTGIQARAHASTKRRTSLAGCLLLTVSMRIWKNSPLAPARQR